MITKINDTVYKFEFNVFPFCQQTACIVYNQSYLDNHPNAKKENAVIFAVVTYLSKTDKYDVEKGKWWAFKKVLHHITQNQTKVDKKEFRKEAWSAFFAREHTEPSTTNPITE